MFDEMFLQRSEEFVGNNLIGFDASGALYQGIVSFLIVGLMSNVPYIIRAVRETEVTSICLKGETKKNTRTSSYYWLYSE